MRKKLEKFNRVDIFNHYNNETNPFIYVTTRIDITNIYKNCKYYYPSIAFFLHQALDKIDNFKYRFEDNSFYYYNHLKQNFTEMKNDGNIGFFDVEYTDNYKKFISDYLNKKEKMLNGDKMNINNDQGEIWYSCLPWFNTSQIVSPFNKNITVPQLIWDKFIFEGDNVYVNLTIMVHHGFIDGFHLGKFIKNYEEISNNIEKYI